MGALLPFASHPWPCAHTLDDKMWGDCITLRDLGWGGGGTHFNVRFYPSAGAAQSGGFRACKRCRPDATPGSPEWNGRADLVGRAMRLIADGVVDREGVKGLARRLCYTERHLHRMLVAEVGAGPIALAERWRPWWACAVQHCGLRKTRCR